MAFLADAEGAHFAIWQPGDHAGAGLVNEPVSFAWNELITRNIDAARGFYSPLFGWEIDAAEDSPVDYCVITNAGRLNGGIIPWMEEALKKDCAMLELNKEAFAWGERTLNDAMNPSEA